MTSSRKKMVLASASLLLLGSVGCDPQSREDVHTIQQAIVGGNVATPGEYPWMAQISTSAEPGSPFLPVCGGSLIAPNWVLTAAHCLVDDDGTPLPAGSIQVTLGEHDLANPETPPEQIKAVATNGVIPHEGFNSTTLVNDIGLLQLSSAATLNARVQLLRLAVDGDGPGTDAWISGWGGTEFGIFGPQPPSQFLKELFTHVVGPTQVDPPAFSGDTCESTAQGVIGRGITSADICIANNLGDDNHQATCFGDSGSPLVVQRSPTCSEQIGILSTGNPFCVRYNILARVTSHLDWIRQRVPSISARNVHEAETMVHSTGGAYPGGWNIWSNGYASFNRTFTGGMQKMVVTAAGQNGNGWPNMQVTVNGAVVFNTLVTTTAWTDYAFFFNAPNGGAEVRVNFTNDFYQPPLDRNLLLDKVTVVTGTCPPPAPPPDSLTASFRPGDDWGFGYCLTIAATNNASVPTTNWSAAFNVGDGSIYTTWNGTFTATTGAITVTPTIPNSRVLGPGATDTQVGFCANRGPSGFKPQNIDIFGTGVY